MKKTTLLFLAIFALTITASAQDIIFKETFGTTQPTRGTCTSVTVPGTAETGKYDPQKNEQFADHLWTSDSHVWNTGVAYSQTSATTANAGACDDTGTTVNIRSNKPSTYNGASGDGNLYFNANILNSFTITGINTLNYENVSLSFGIYGKNKADVTLLKLQYNIGSGLTETGATQIGALSTTKDTWSTISNIILPSNTSLSLTFYTPNTNPLNLLLGVPQPIEIRIDDIKITGTLKIADGNLQVTTDNRKLTVSNATMTLKGFTTGNVEIYNIQGKRVFISELKETIQPQLSKGLYIVRIGDFRQKISL